MDRGQLQSVIEAAFEARDGISADTKGEVRDAVDETLNLLDSGALRVAEKGAGGDWTVNQWAKMAVLLSFRLNDMTTIEGGPGGATWWDKVPSKFDGWGDAEFTRFPRCSQLYRAPQRPYRTERGANAQFRKPWRFC